MEQVVVMPIEWVWKCPKCKQTMWTSDEPIVKCDFCLTKYKGVLINDLQE